MKQRYRRYLAEGFRDLIRYPLSAVFYLCYGLLLGLFHPVLVVALWAGGDKPRKQMVDLLNRLLVYALYLLGCRVTFRGFEKIPQGRPLIIVSNHQSMFDIPAVVHGFRAFYPRFISKIELSKNLPSISHNLKHGRSALIDRKNGTQSVKEIFKLGRLIEERKEAACIFPEGTRSKTGKLGPFMTAGLHTLLRAAPSAVIIPFVIDGHSRLMRRGSFPLGCFQRMTYTVLDPIEPGNNSIDELVTAIREPIEKALIFTV
jgi:1-acyl-sn-glycerol-3-phosphate acyltransferase